MKHVILILSLTGIFSNAYAGQSAQLLCTQTEVHYQNDSRIEVCVRQELSVDITTDGDAGMFGVFVVGIKLADNSYAVWSVENGWQPADRLAVTQIYPANGIYDAVPAYQHFVVFDGPPKRLCEMQNQRDFQIYAGHGVLSSEEVAQVQRLAEKYEDMAANMQASGLKRSYSKPGNNGIVYEGKCASNNPQAGD